MELKLIRKTKTDQSTIGDLYVNDQWECFTLEDVDRGLTQSMPAEEIKIVKIYGKTAIPTGRYEVIVSFSNKFKKRLPLLLNVPGFEGIRIHPGNAPKDTFGCILCGEDYSDNIIYKSRNAFYDVFEKIEKAIQAEKVFITIQ